MSLVVQWLRLCVSNAGDEDSIPGQGNKIPQAMWHSQKTKKNFFFFCKAQLEAGRVQIREVCC